MSDNALDLSTTGRVDPEFLRNLIAVADAFHRTGDESEKAGDKAAKSATDWAILATGVRAAFDTAGRAVGQIRQFVEGIVALSAEQESLDRNSERLGLNFDRAAAAAGRFVDETETMAFASRLAEAGLRVTQEQLDQLSRRAAIFAQNTGGTTAEAFDRLFTGIESGSTRALRGFGSEMLAFAGDEHTAEERLNAFAESTRRMASATNDARSQWERFKDAIADTQREAAGGFMGGLTESAQRADAATAHHTTTTSESTLSLREWADVAGETVGTMEDLGLGMTDVVGAGLALIGMLGGIEGSTTGWDSAMLHLDAQIDRVVADLGLLPANVNSTASSFRAAATEGESLADTFGHLTAQYGAFARLVATGGESDPNIAARLRERLIKQTIAKGAANRGRGRTADERPTASGLRTLDEAFSAAVHAQESDDAYLAPGMRHTSADERRALAEQRRREEEATGAAEDLARRNAIGKREAGSRMTEAETARYDFSGREARNDNDRHFRGQEQSERSLGSRVDEAFKLEITAAGNAKMAVVDAFQQMTNAGAAHFDALVNGQETAGEALQGFVHDTLSAFAKISAQQSIFELAKGFASLFFNPAEAGAHFAAAGLFAAIAATSGAAAGAMGSEGKSAASAGGGSANGGRAEPVGRVGANDAARQPQVINIQFGTGVVMGTPRQVTTEMARLLNHGAAQGFIELNPRILGRTGTDG